MGEMIIKILRWFIKEAKLPRACWFIFSGGVLFVLVMLGLRIHDSQDILINATEKFQIAVRAHERAERAHKQAQEVKNHAYELHKQAQKQREQIRDKMDQKLTEIINLLERTKNDLGPEVFASEAASLPPNFFTELLKRRHSAQERIETTQMDLRRYKKELSEK